MNRIRVILAGFAMVAALSTSQLQGAVVFQSVPDITAAPGGGGWCSTCGGSYAAVDQFTLLSDTSVTGFNLVAQSETVFGNGGIGNVGVTIYDASISSILFQQIVTTSLVLNTGFDTNIVTASLTGLDLVAGTYRISFFGTDSDMGLPGFTGGNGTLIQVTAANSTTLQFDHAGENIGYELLSEASGVPEPSSWALVSLGAVALGMSRKKFRKA